jgi:3,4-dihydroxy 2-butanone 4-phosphate synthase/GTP cyclohydrolase II
MAKHGRGLICLALTEEQVEQLELPMMKAPAATGPRSAPRSP